MKSAIAINQNILSCFRWQFSCLSAAILWLLLPACQGYEESITIKRFPQLNAELNGRVWQAREVVVEEVERVVVYESENSSNGRFYQRITLLAINTDEPTTATEFLRFSVDVPALGSLPGTYRTTYNDIGGLAEFSYQENRSNTAFPLYQLCQGSMADTEIIIERQSTEERLISGTFRAVLCERANSSDTLFVGNGTFRDISY
jgi:hypothetical protein